MKPQSPYRVGAGLAPALALLVVSFRAVAMLPATVARVARHIRGRDYALLGACLLTILLGYLPYYIMGHGQVLGYFTTYSSEQGENAGIVQLVIQWMSLWE